MESKEPAKSEVKDSKTEVKEPKESKYLIKEGMPSFPGIAATGVVALFERSFRAVLGGLRNPTSAEVQLGRAVIRSVFLALGAKEEDGRFVYLRTDEAIEDLQKRVEALEKREP